ncbi:MAG: hypothetical protein ACOYJB_03085 [Christensenellaceae bacterium]|jgi:hypothetical protein
MSMSRKEPESMDAVFRRMAEGYVQQYGADLHREMEELERGTKSITPGLDAKVKQLVASQKRKKNSRIWGILAAGAACLLVVLVTTTFYQNMPSQSYPPVAEEAAAPEEAASAYPAEEAGASEAEAPAQAETPVYEDALIPLSAELPENFSISAVEQDVGQTIYHLSNTKLDDAVVTLEYADLPDTADLNEYDIGGHTAYGKYGADYSVLMFTEDDILYTLTCQHDLNTLMELGEAILI